ncbi:MAG TPA: hypothetical protein VMZ53_18135 [Kofleriaceae bacterium]|nr:hypothetical protein [Kofleriaceae bacterium]
MEQATCTDALHAVELFDPPLDDRSPEREWQLQSRRFVMMCEGWSTVEKNCLRDATTPDATNACVTLAPEIHARLLSLSSLAASIADLRRSLDKIDCTTVAVTHNSEAFWNATFDREGLKRADRKALLDGARYTMASACVDEQWDDTQRACMIAGGGEMLCLRTRTPAWDASYIGLTPPADCREYQRAEQALQKCPAVSSEDVDALTGALDTWDEGSGDQRQAIARMCKTYVSKIRATLTAAGC